MERNVSVPSSDIRVLQFTDTHLFASSDQTLCGMNPAQSLQAVLNLAHKNDWAPDVILVTGDLSQDETPESYKRFLDFFEPLGIPVFCLPGNHDRPELMQDVLSARNVHTTRQILLGAWQIILLDSSVAGEHTGNLKKTELAFLNECLYEHDSLFSLVCLHHNVLPTQTPWLDRMTLKNAGHLFRVCDQYAGVKGILTGHIHQEFFVRRSGPSVIATPSTCIQFLQGSKKFSLDEAAPGYRWLRLKENGSLDTGVKRLKKFMFTPDISSKGY